LFWFFFQLKKQTKPVLGGFGLFFFDTLSVSLRILSLLIFLYLLKFLKKLLTNILVLNLIILLFTFCFSNFFLFFLGFELSLIPILILILGWGSTPERLTASSYLLIYTLTFSIPFLALLINLYQKEEVLSFGVLINIFKETVFSSIDWIMFFWVLCFFVKVPIYGLHLWLAKAHVEAPVFGSILLASILLKLGLYGLVRSFLFWKFKHREIKNVFIIFLLIGLVLTGFICFRQIDIKSLIAYSSIQHMMLGVLGLTTFSSLKVLGITLVAIFHGFISCSLFFGFNVIYYFSKTRNIVLNFGLLKIFPLLMAFWFICLALNSGIPPSGNFFFRKFFWYFPFVNFEFEVFPF